MRPTIPLADWRIAVDLVATHALSAVVPPPPCGRTCPWCRNWAAAHAAALPARVTAELRRLGVAPAEPADLYAYAEPEGDVRGAVPHRATFYAVGRILSGPPQSSEHARLGPGRHYAPPDGVASSLQAGLSVAHARDLGEAASWHAGAPGPLLQIDFRLPVPWLLGEPRPQVFAGVPARGAV